MDRINASTYGNNRKYWTRAVRAIALLGHVRTPAPVTILEDVATGHPEARPTSAAKEAPARPKK